MQTQKLPSSAFFDKIYVITIQTSTDRQAFINEKLKSFDFDLFFGVNGRTLTPGEISERYSSVQAKINCGRDLNLGEIGCALSHREVYADMLKKGFETALILEDDVFFDTSKSDHLFSALKGLPRNWDLLYLGYNRNNSRSSLLKTLFIKCLNPILRFFRYIKFEKHDYWGTHYRHYNKHLNYGGSYDLAHAYAIKKSLAQHIVERQTPISDTADGILIKIASTGFINVYTTREQIFVQSDLFESSIWGGGRKKQVENSLQPEDVCMIVFTSALNLRERALSVQNTWLKSFPIGSLIGGYHLDSKLRMISLGPDIGEDYQSATKKQFIGLKTMIERHPMSPWYFVTGCDAFVFSENLLVALEQFDYREDHFVGGHCGQIMVNGEPILFPSGGPGFALSNSLAIKILPTLEKMLTDWETEQTDYKGACDVAIAYYLKKMFSIQLSYLEGFYHCPPYRYPANTYIDGSGSEVNREVINRPLAFHMLSIREMYKLSANKKIETPNWWEKLFDRWSIFMTKKRKSRSIVNYWAGQIFGISRAKNTN